MASRIVRVSRRKAGEGGKYDFKLQWGRAGGGGGGGAEGDFQGLSFKFQLQISREGSNK